MPEGFFNRTSHQVANVLMNSTQTNFPNMKDSRALYEVYVGTNYTDEPSLRAKII